MINELNNWYFSQIIKCIDNHDISGAIAIAERLSITQMNDNLKKLASLCYYRFGSYDKAVYYAGTFNEYSTEYKDAFDTFNQYREKIIEKMKEKDYITALKIITESSLHSVLENNIAGCLHLLCEQKKEGILLFKNTLKMDIYNKDAMKYLIAANEIQQNHTILRFIKKLWKR